MGLLSVIVDVVKEAEIAAGVVEPGYTPVVEPISSTPGMPTALPGAAPGAPGGGGGGVTRQVVTRSISHVVQPQAVVTNILEVPQDWWNPISWLQRSFQTPQIMLTPVGAVSKTIFKLGAGGLIAGGIGGFLLGGLLGGGSQEQQQDITQAPDVTVTPDQTVSPMMRFLMDIITQQRIQAGAGIDISGGEGFTGDIGTTTTYQSTQTYPTTYNIQKTLTTQITETHTTTTAAQEAKQEGGMNILAIAAIAIAAIFILPKIFKKKRAG